jgi:hypothetical protein
MDAAAKNPAARLTIDLAMDDDYLVPLTQYATANWLTTGRPVLDYANAMVSSEQTSASMLEDGWREHIEGRAGIPPLAPSKLTGSPRVTTRFVTTPAVYLAIDLASRGSRFPCQHGWLPPRWAASVPVNGTSSLSGMIS